MATMRAFPGSIDSLIRQMMMMIPLRRNRKSPNFVLWPRASESLAKAVGARSPPSDKLPLA